jgi:DNA-binding SARP family transcriptional activator
MQNPPSLWISLLGDFSCVIGGREVSFPTHSVERLLAYLILKRGKPVSRSTLAGSLWPDSSDLRAARSLNTTLWRAKRALSNGNISSIDFRSEQGRLLLELKEVSIDVREFQDLAGTAPLLPLSARASQLRRAIGLYQGDLLEGIDDEWLLPERSALRNRYFLLLRDLVDTCIATDDYREGLLLARRLLELDSLDESSHRRLMLLRFLSGDRAGALMQYRQLAVSLNAELGVEPSAETQNLWLRMKSADRTTIGASEVVQTLATSSLDAHRSLETGPVVMFER